MQNYIALILYALTADYNLINNLTKREKQMLIYADVCTIALIIFFKGIILSG